MQPNYNVDASKLIDRLFKVKKLQFNTYEISHDEVKGQLRLITIPVNLLEVPRDQLPRTVETGDLPVFMVGSQNVAGFSNRGKRVTPKIRTSSTIGNAKKVDITNFVVQEQTFEPWNEFVVQGTPPLIVKLRTILTRLDWLQGDTNPIGDPALSAISDQTQSVSIALAGEAGMT